MLAARLHHARDIRIDEVNEPAAPGPGQALIQVTAVGICGSDLHSYEDGRIGDTVVQQPLILGHEFGGEVLACGADAHATGKTSRCARVNVWRSILHSPVNAANSVWPVTPTFVAVCTSAVCGRTMARFVNACSCRRMVAFRCQTHSAMPTRPCWSRWAWRCMQWIWGACVWRAASSCLAAGPIGLLIIRLAQLAGADPIYACDRFPWRAQAALAWGASDAWCCASEDSVAHVQQLTGGRGADVVFEAAWAQESVAQAAEMARPGGRVVLVGIPSADILTMKHSTARRKGLTILMSRRMKHTYPRAIRLALGGAFELEALISRRYPLAETAAAFASYAAWEPGVQKLLVEP